MSRRINIRDEYQNKFYQLPKVFFTSDQYKNMSNNAKIAWAILRDRSELSAKNNWIDGNGDIYFIYTNENLMEILNIGSKATLQKVKKELLEAGLLEQERQGLQKANRLYLLNPVVTMADVYLIDQNEKGIGVDQGDFEESLSKVSDSNRSTESELLFSKSGSTENELPEVQKVNTNDTELNKTKDNKDNKEPNSGHKNELFNSSVKEQDDESDELLINTMIEDNSLETIFGETMLSMLLGQSRGSFDIFKEWIDLIVYAIKSANKEMDVSLFSYLLNIYGETVFAEEFRKDLVITVRDVLFRIRTDKFNKIKDQKSYLFISVKQTAMHWAENSKNQ